MAKVGTERIEETENPELAFERATEISKKQEPKTFNQNKEVAIKSGQIAGNTRKEIEEQTGDKIITAKNAKGLIGNTDNKGIKAR